MNTLNGMQLFYHLIKYRIVFHDNIQIYNWLGCQSFYRNTPYMFYTDNKMILGVKIALEGEMNPKSV